MTTSIVIFGVAYLLIALTSIPNTVIALLGAVAMVFSGALSGHDAFRHIDLNVILLLAGMMILADIVGRTGFFQWSAIQSARAVRAHGFGMLVLLCFIAAFASAFLDNVTTVVLLVPVTLTLCRKVGLDPVPFLIGEILASNIGGAATLIGDPPNIIIGSVADIDFLSFLVNLTPIIVVCFVVLLGLLFLWFRNQLGISEAMRRELIAENPAKAITARLLTKSLAVMGLTIVGFLIHGLFDIEPAFIAIGGAALLLLVSGIEPADALREVQWSTLFFFVGLFIMVGGLIENGVLDVLQSWLIRATGGDQNVLALALVSFSGVASGIVDNIPYTAAMTPVVKDIAGERGAGGISELWWALSLGANLGGNLTLVGASANVLVANIARASGHPISFLGFLKYGAVTTVCTLALATAYLWLRSLG